MVLSAKLPHIAQMIPLFLLNETSSSQSKPLWITNTHLYYHPQASHIRLLQMLFLLRHIDTVIKETPGEVILCGDLNSSSQNAACKIIFDRSVPANYRSTRDHLNTFRDHSLQPSEEVFVALDDDFPSFQLPDSFPALHSAIDPLPEFTHLTHEFRGALDHIMFSTSKDNGRLKPLSSAPMPSIKVATANTGMPSRSIPSDHISLVCDFQITDGGAPTVEPSIETNDKSQKLT
jgi:2',5'-phosphodiesterase